MISINVEYNLATLLNEKQMVSNKDDTFPREITNYNLHELLMNLRRENAEYEFGIDEYFVIFNVEDEMTSKIIRSIQEDQILKTKLKLNQKDKLITLKSFWEIWNVNNSFRNEIINSTDSNEEKWKLTRKYGYKMATTFMPAYAKALYEYFGCPKIVLDPCSGWGDRMLGAEVAGIEKYIGFDPNTNLRPGYSDVMELCGHQPTELASDYIGFSNSYEIYSTPFEIGATALGDNSVDFIFTSPPFFDYEIYTDINPKYRDWMKGFYEPLFKQCSRIVKPNCYVCIYISDTSAGEIDRFIQEEVSKFTRLVLQQKHIGFRGLWSNVVRKIWVFKKSE